MIKRLRVSNYRSLGKVDIRFEDKVTAFVGPNSSGKSSLIDSLQFISDCLQVGLEGAITKRQGIGAICRWQAKGMPYLLSISLDIENEDWTGGYSFSLRGARTEDYRVQKESAWIQKGEEKHHFHLAQGKLQGLDDLRPRIDPMGLLLPMLSGDERYQVLARELRRMVVYSIFPNALSEPQRYDPSRPMDEHGRNWVSILKDMDQGGWKEELLAALGDLTGDLIDLKVASAGGYLIAQFRHQGAAGEREKWFDAVQESDGTLRVAGILTALLQDSSLPLIGIEEPELTVHPGAIPLLADFIHQAAEHSQVVVTTHSPEFLDQFDVEQIRVVERRNGETTVSLLEERQKNLVRERLMSLGEVMRTVGFEQQQAVGFTE